MLVEQVSSTFAHAYHNTRSDLDVGADGCVEGGGSRPCAGGGVILWERALLAWGIGDLLESQPVRARKTRKGDLTRRQTQTSCAPAAAALPPWPQVAAAVLNRQRARHKAASFMRNRPTPSGSPESPRAAGRSPRLQTAGRPGAQRTRSELSAVRCRRRGESAQVSPRILRPVGHLRRGCHLRTGLQRSLGSWRRAGVSEGMRLRPLQRAQRLAARRVGAADHPRGASQIRARRLRAGRGAEHDERIFRPRHTPRIRCRQVVAPPALEALSGRGVAATTQRSRTWHAAAPSKHLAAALL